MSAPAEGGTAVGAVADASEITALPGDGATARAELAAVRVLPGPIGPRAFASEVAEWH